MSETVKTPGFVDVHTHLREPSSNTAETIENGTRAAMLGGFVLVADMPNNPGNPTWNKDRLDEKTRIAEDTAYIPTAFYAGCQPEGDTVGELAAMAPGAIGLKLYGAPTTANVRNYEAQDFSEIVKEWHRVAPKKPIVFHAGPDNLQDMIELVAGRHQHPMHIAHVNSPDQVELKQAYEQNDCPVTCGVCVHHLLKTSHDRTTQGVFAEMMPPLAPQSDAEELMHLLDTGAITNIETDYAPHAKEAKWEAEESGGHCYGVPGIEHVVPLLFYQVQQERLSFERLIEAFSAAPADLLGLSLGADTYVEWDLTQKYRIENEAEQVSSGAGWSPYLGMLAMGKIKQLRIGQTGHIIADGHVLKGARHPEIVSARGHEFI